MGRLFYSQIYKQSTAMTDKWYKDKEWIKLS
jgi:hypothetical protein